MSLALELKEDLDFLLAETGIDTVIILVEPGAGPEPVATETQVTVRAVAQSNVRRWSPWETQDGDRLLTLGTTGLSRLPRRGDMVLLAGERWAIMNARTREIQGTTIAYTLQLRR